MAIEIKMPALSPTMKSGILTKWFVGVGDVVKPGSVIAEIETDKASMEVEAVDRGTIGKILVEAGPGSVLVGTVIALMLERGEDASVADSYYIAKTSKIAEAPAFASLASGSSNQTILDVSQEKEQKKNALQIYASPLAKKIAQNMGIDLANVSGTGPNGRIIKRDVEATELSSTEKLDAALSVPQHLDSVPHTAMRRAIATRLLESKRQSPHFYISIECNLSTLFDMRGRLNESYNKQSPEHQINISVNDLIVKAAAIALRHVPDINVSWTEEGLIMHKAIDISIAVSVPGGLITPIIKDADRISLIELSAISRTLIKRARGGKLLPEEFQGGTFSVSNLGMYGIREFYPIINPPQSAILAIGSTEKRPIVSKDGCVKVADMCILSLSADHRAIDGVIAAQYLKFLQTVVENPMMLSL